jgi:hypothetical protein
MYLQKKYFILISRLASNLQNLILMLIYSRLLLILWMARVRLTVRKHVHMPPRRNVVSTESHSDGQNAGYFPMTLWTVLLALGYSKPLLFVGVPRLLRGNSYHWRVCVIIYDWPMTDHIRHIHHVVEATTPRWTFEGGMREAAREALVLLWHEAEEQMEQL